MDEKTKFNVKLAKGSGMGYALRANLTQKGTSDRLMPIGLAPTLPSSMKTSIFREWLVNFRPWVGQFSWLSHTPLPASAIVNYSAQNKIWADLVSTLCLNPQLLEAKCLDSVGSYKQKH